jgi:hypothetical protein
MLEVAVAYDGTFLMVSTPARWRAAGTEWHRSLIEHMGAHYT